MHDYSAQLCVYIYTYHKTSIAEYIYWAPLIDYSDGFTLNRLRSSFVGFLLVSIAFSLIEGLGSLGRSWFVHPLPIYSIRRTLVIAATSTEEMLRQCSLSTFTPTEPIRPINHCPGPFSLSTKKEWNMDRHNTELEALDYTVRTRKTYTTITVLLVSHTRRRNSIREYIWRIRSISTA